MANFLTHGLLGLLVGCSAQGDRVEPAVDAARPAEQLLVSRAEIVARSDQLAVEAEREGGAVGAARLVEAAYLRKDIWRREGRRVDALEAIELLRLSAEKLWDGACDAAAELAVLEGELIAEPQTSYRGLHTAQLTHRLPECRAKIERSLGLLAGFKPSDSNVAVLGEATGAQAGASPSASHEPASAADLVVQPEVSPQATGPVELGTIESYGAEDSARIVVQVSAPAQFESGFIEASDGQGPRFYVDIKQASFKGQRTHEVGGVVRRVRLGEQPGGTRVVLDLAQAAHRRVFYLPEPFRLVIDVSKHAPRVAQRGEARGPLAIRRVVLDPGHGGHDPGAVGSMGLQEKDVTLDIAHRAAPLIARELGISTLLTRDSDVYVPLAERTARANAFRADLFVSIHCNASETVSGHGVMTFVLAASNDRVASAVAARENASSVAASSELARALAGIQGSTRVESQHFAGLLQRSAMASVGSRYTGLVDRGVKSAGFYVLAGAEMPAVLFETSFISNPTEEIRLDSADYRQKMADAIVNAVRAYREGL